jgi:hypothetical protein
METDNPFPYSHNIITETYLKQVESSRCHSKIHFHSTSTFHFTSATSGFPKYFVPFRFSDNKLQAKLAALNFYQLMTEYDTVVVYVYFLFISKLS